MRFYLGETYEKRDQGQQRWALVVRLADGGATATLRFADTEEERTLRWEELSQAVQWRRVSTAGESN